jgi:hypothetical protein
MDDGVKPIMRCTLCGIVSADEDDTYDYDVIDVDETS